MVEKAILKKCDKLEDTRFAPYDGEFVFIINRDILIFEEEIIEDFDVEFYKDIFEIIETVQ